MALDDLDALVRDLMEDPSYAAGRRHPRATTPDEAAGILEDVYRVHADEARHLPVVAEQMGHPIACARGCAECCHELIGVTHVEVHALAVWLAEPPQAELRARVVARARAWVAAAGDRAALAYDRMRAGDDAGYRALRREHALARVMCPANEDGACQVYPVRPLICRLPYVVDTAENCPPRTPPGPPAQLVSTPRYARFEATARQLVSGLEGAIGHDSRARAALPVALLEALDELVARAGTTA